MAGFEPAIFCFRRRRDDQLPHTQIVPTPGIEPDPSGFQADAHNQIRQVGKTTCSGLGRIRTCDAPLGVRVYSPVLSAAQPPIRDYGFGYELLKRGHERRHTRSPEVGYDGAEGCVAIMTRTKIKTLRSESQAPLEFTFTEGAG